MMAFSRISCRYSGLALGGRRSISSTPLQLRPKGGVRLASNPLQLSVPR